MAFAIDSPSLGGWPGTAAMGGLVGLALWQGVSGAWSFQPSASTTAMNQTFLYAAALVMRLLGVRRAQDLQWVLGAALAGSTVVVA